MYLWVKSDDHTLFVYLPIPKFTLILTILFLGLVSYKMKYLFDQKTLEESSTSGSVILEDQAKEASFEVICIVKSSRPMFGLNLPLRVGS